MAQASSVERQTETLKRLDCDLILVERESGTTAEQPEYQKLLRIITNSYPEAFRAQAELPRLSQLLANFAKHFKITSHKQVVLAIDQD